MAILVNIKFYKESDFQVKYVTIHIFPNFKTSVFNSNTILGHGYFCKHKSSRGIRFSSKISLQRFKKPLEDTIKDILMLLGKKEIEFMKNNMPNIFILNSVRKQFMTVKS